MICIKIYPKLKDVKIERWLFDAILQKFNDTDVMLDLNDVLESYIYFMGQFNNLVDNKESKVYNFKNMEDLLRDYNLKVAIIAQFKS